MEWIQFDTSTWNYVQQLWQLMAKIQMTINSYLPRHKAGKISVVLVTYLLQYSMYNNFLYTITTPPIHMNNIKN